MLGKPGIPSPQLGDLLTTERSQVSAGPIPSSSHHSNYINRSNEKPAAIIDNQTT